MITHFTYQHLPAAGLGVRDPRRPYVTGGVGGGVPVYVTKILEWRIYTGDGRNVVTSDRSLLVAARDLIVANRNVAVSERQQLRVARIFADVETALVRLDRSMSTSSRSYGSGDRDLN